MADDFNKNLSRNLSDAGKELKNIETSILNINSALEKSVSLFKDSKDLLKDFSDESADIKDAADSVNDALESIDIKKFSEEIKDCVSSVLEIYKDLSSSFRDFFHYDLTPYDDAVERAKNKLKEFDDYQKELKEDKKSRDNEDYENYLLRLDEELELAVKNNDAMSAEAIRIKREELDKKYAKEKEDLEKDKDIKSQRELLEKQLAHAQYSRDHADWTNKVKLAEMEKSKAIADAVLIPSLAIAQSALGVASSFGQGGPAGFAAGLIISAAAVSSVLSAASGIVSSANALDSIKSNPPEPPKFAFGTSGYIIPNGGSAIVGEMGAEIVTNKSGKIQVQSNAQLQEMGFSKGDIWNVTINVESALNPDEVYKLMNSYKLRNSQMYTR